MSDGAGGSLPGGLVEADVRSALESRREEIETKVAAMTKAPERGTGISFGKRVGDGTNEAISRLTEVGVVDNLQATLRKIDRAQEKLDEGTYGICDVCGEEIPRARLEFAPESAVCVKDAR